jgi:type II secretory pathway component PulF
MPVFEYRGRSSEGEAVLGKLEADDRDGALAQLREQDVLVSSLSDAAPVRRSKPRATGAGREPQAPGLKSLTRRVPLMQRAMFWRQMQQSQHAGMGVLQTLDLLGRGGFGHLSAFARQAAAHMGRESVTLSAVMKGVPELFGALEIAMVRAGEAHGRLDTQAERLSVHFERELSVWQTLRWRLAYLGCTAGAFVLSMFAVVVIAPVASALVMGQQTDLLARTLRFALPFVGVVAALIGLRVALASSMVLRQQLDKLKIRLPGLGGLFLKISVARYARALGELIGAGLPVGEAAEVAAPVAGNLYLRRRFLGLPAQLRRGMLLSDALISACEMPFQVIQMVRTGEHSGSVDQMLDKVAEYYEQEAVAATQTLVYVGFAAGLVLAGIITGIYVIRFYAGYFQNALGMM